MAVTSILPADLLAAGARCGEALRRRGESVSIAECSCGGLITTALLAVPGASAYLIGGSVIYTRKALEALYSDPLRDRLEPPAKLRGASEPWALHLARCARVSVDATWGIGEGGASGPSGNAYGDPAGHAWVAVSGPTEVTRHVLTGNDDRVENMVAFAIAALTLFGEQLSADA